MLVGVGAVGALVAPILARAGLRVVGLEAGPFRTRRDFVPDELGSAYYARGDMGPKFLSETPRWRLRDGAPTREATYTLGRMMNAVGVCSSHDLGGCRMGEDPTSSVVDPELRAHDTPGLYVFGGADFSTCHSVNPTLTMWALCYRAAERLVEHLRRGEE